MEEMALTLRAAAVVVVASRFILEQTCLQAQLQPGAGAEQTGVEPEQSTFKTGTNIPS
jgi:hypothetical protein